MVRFPEVFCDSGRHEGRTKKAKSSIDQAKREFSKFLDLLEPADLLAVVDDGSALPCAPAASSWAAVAVLMLMGVVMAAAALELAFA
jgi:hypothetical protein